MPVNTEPRPIENPHTPQGEIIFHSGQHISGQIEADATARGQSDIVGLAIADDKRKYVVIDAGIKEHVDRTATVKMGLPKFDGPRSFRRKEVEVTTEKVGMPRLTGFRIPGLDKIRDPIVGKVRDIAAPDGDRAIERQQVPRQGVYSYVPVVTVEVYDSAGDVIGLEEYAQDDFYGIADTLGHRDHDGHPILGSMSAEWMQPEPIAHDVDFHIDLPVSITKHKGDGRGVPLAEHESDKGFKAFEKVEEELKKHKIDSWQGLSWEYGDIVQEIVFDKGIKHETYGPNMDKVSVRTFGIKTTHDGRTVGLEIMNDRKFAEYLQRATDPEAQLKAQGRDPETILGAHLLKSVRMSREKHESPLADEQHRYLGWLANPRDTEEKRAANEHEAEIRDYIESGITSGSPEGFFPYEDRVAVWLLDYGDILDDDQRTGVVTEMYDSHNDRLKVDRVKTLIEDYGLPVVYDTAYKLREAFLESMKKLDHPITFEDQSLSNVLRILVDNHHSSIRNLLSATDAAQFEQNAIVSELVGRSVGSSRVITEDSSSADAKAMILELRQMKPTGRIINNQKETKLHAEFIFNEDFFKGNDAPAISSNQVASRVAQDTLRDPLIKVAHEIFVKIKSGHGTAGSANRQDYVELGDMLRRWVGSQYR